MGSKNSMTYTVDEVAALFGTSPGNVRQMEYRGHLQRMEGVPGVRFRKSEIDGLLGIGPLNEKVKRLEAENKQLRETVEALKNKIRNVLKVIGD